ACSCVQSSTEKSWLHFRPPAVDFCMIFRCATKKRRRARALAMPRPMPRIARQCMRGVETTALLHLAALALDGKTLAAFSPAGGLLFRRAASRYASLAHLYRAFGMAFLRGCYRQILGPSRHLPKFSNSLCRHADAWVHLDPHLIWQATKSYVERGNAFRLKSHKGLPQTAPSRLPTARSRLLLASAAIAASRVAL